MHTKRLSATAASRSAEPAQVGHWWDIWAVSHADVREQELHCLHELDTAQPLSLTSPVPTNVVLSIHYSMFHALRAIAPVAGGDASYPGVDPPSCQLLGPTALVVQGLMGILVILSLVYKRHRETPKRPWRIWLFDVSKQVVGQLFVHGANLLVSGLASHHTSSNACVSYFLNILIDTTFGVGLIYVTLHALTRLFTEKFQLKGFESGVYGDPPSFNFWLRQAALYVLTLSTMKVVVVTFLVLFPAIYVVGEWLLSWTWTSEGDDLQVIFVMGIFPIMMNILQFWLIDSIVKASAAAGVALDVERDAQQDREPLFQAGSDDEDGDHPSRLDNSRRSHRSLDSLDSRGLQSRDDLSFATGITTPDEHKSSGSPPNNEIDGHAYPPTPRVAKNLMKKAKRRDGRVPPSPRQPEGSCSISQTPVTRPAVPVPPTRETPEWQATWEDNNVWDATKHQNTQSSTAQIP
ncbi:unnamed protein product [Cyclocybe aegerita]|uniref:Vacuolar membrane protein n=1 Tax=Cyclocybe aegerita TaxID=1973307 RepID=A0A8S0XM59_CYCAE|nr:unnamed protein product [Cyclocybe aegerita]